MGAYSPCLWDQVYHAVTVWDQDVSFIFRTKISLNIKLIKIINMCF
jgi:hypothetical protein